MFHNISAPFFSVLRFPAPGPTRFGSVKLGHGFLIRRRRRAPRNPTSPCGCQPQVSHLPPVRWLFSTENNQLSFQGVLLDVGTLSGVHSFRGRTQGDSAYRLFCPLTRHLGASHADHSKNAKYIKTALLERFREILLEGWNFQLLINSLRKQKTAPR